MSKLRVHEIARELDKSNKEVMDFLKSKNIDVKSHMSSLEDDHVSLIRANLRKGNVAAASTDSAKPAASAEEKPKKKLIQVFRPQNEVICLRENKNHRIVLQKQAVCTAAASRGTIVRHREE